MTDLEGILIFFLSFIMYIIMGVGTYRSSQEKHSKGKYAMYLCCWWIILLIFALGLEEED